MYSLFRKTVPGNIPGIPGIPGDIPSSDKKSDYFKTSSICETKLIYYNMLKIFDLHNDYILKLKGYFKHRYIKKNSNNSIISAVWTSELNEYESINEINNAKNFVINKQNLYFSVEDLHFLNKNNLEKFILARPTYAGLTWNTSNAIAGGAHEQGGVTNFGKTVVKECEKNNIIVDTAHLNEDSFMGVSKLYNNPLFCSHTAFYGVNENKRNLKDYQIKMIVESGGLVGLCLVSEFLNGTKRSTVKDVVSHIDYFACKFGIDNLALGTDFYGTDHLPKELKNYNSLIQKLSFELSKLGYTEKSISKIFFDNAYNFLFSTKNI